MRNLRWTSLFVLACCVVGLAQQQTTPVQQRDREIKAQVATLLARLQYSDADRADKDRYYDELEAVTQSVRDQIDKYVQTVVDPRETAQQIQDQLRALLPRAPNPQYGDPPFALVADLPTSRSLLVAYTIVRPPHHDSATVRGYRRTLNQFELVAVIPPQDFDGFSMFKRELRSPLAGDLWIMAWGQAEGANGKIVRFRVYAFDGQTFRTVWSPEEMFNANVRFTETGFVIDHYRRPYDIHDEYLLTANGPIKTN
jgi:hypothetical protein